MPLFSAAIFSVGLWLCRGPRRAWGRRLRQCGGCWPRPRWGRVGQCRHGHGRDVSKGPGVVVGEGLARGDVCRSLPSGKEGIGTDGGDGFGFAFSRAEPGDTVVVGFGGVGVFSEEGFIVGDGQKKPDEDILLDVAVCSADADERASRRRANVLERVLAAWARQACHEAEAEGGLRYICRLCHSIVEVVDSDAEEGRRGQTRGLSAAGCWASAGRVWIQMNAASREEDDGFSQFNMSITSIQDLRLRAGLGGPFIISSQGGLYRPP